MRLSRLPFVVLALVGAILLSQYLASSLFLWWVRADVRNPSLLAIPRYLHYYGGRPDIRRKAAITSAIGLGAIAVASIPVLKPRTRKLHGEARFATVREMATAGLFAPHGILLGQKRLLLTRRKIILGGQQGAIVSAPPRSDKGTAIVVPNCLLWQHSLLCQDIKLENWTLTSGYRASLGQECHLFAPLDPGGNTAAYNPLAYVPSDPNLRIAEVQRTGAILFPEVPGTDPFWTSGGRGMFLGMCLYVLETPSLPPTIGEVLRQGMASDSEGFSEHWKRIIGGRQKGRYPLSPQCVRAISDIMDLAPVTASSIRKTFTSRLDLWNNPLIDAATSRNDFDFRALRKKAVSVYIGIQPADLSLLRPLVNLFIEQALAMQTRELPEHNPELRYQVLALLDETTAPGKIPILASSISYLPGYNVRLLLVIQALSQLREVYGPQAADTMMKSLAARVLYAPKDFSEANEISQELGYTTVSSRSLSKPRGSGSLPGLLSRGTTDRHGSINISDQKRALLLPQEVKELSRDREILIYEGLRPVLAHKNRYYQDPQLRQRILPPLKYATPRLEREAGAASSTPLPIENAGPAVFADTDIASPPPGKAARIDSLTLDDFDVRLGSVKVVQKAEGERMTAAELDLAVNSFLAALEK